MKFIAASLSALLLAPVLALAQEEQPVEVVEEQPAEAPVEEVAPAEQAGDPALAQEVAAQQEAPAEEPEAEPTPGEGTGYIDAYWLPTTVVDVPGALDENGDGMGGRAQYQFWKFLAASAEYTYRNFADADTDVTDTRLGIGVAMQSNSGDSGGLFLQYEKVSSDFDDIDGFAAHGRMRHAISDWFQVYFDLGYGRLQGDVEDYTSKEIDLGILVSIGSAGIFADWRRTMLDGKDSDVQPSVEDVRVGARISFGGES
jgi:opacity protein-like surface antigen